MKTGALFFCIFFLGAGQALAACGDNAQPPAISIEIAESPVRFDTTRTVADLNSERTNTKSPYPEWFHTDVGGMTGSRMSIGQAVRFEKDGDCVRIADVTVTLRAEPVVYIAGDFQGSACRFGPIFAHESLHVEADRGLMDQYRQRFVDGLRLIFAEPDDYMFTAQDEREIEEIRTRTKSDVEGALASLFGAMMSRRTEIQQTIDSLHAYSRISWACQGDAGSR